MSQIQEIKDANNIVEVIGDRLKLQRAGTNNKANCPFHSESTPSFFVSDQLQRYKCFGCGETGDVIEFLEKYEGMSFYESLEYLAENAGIELKKFQRTQEDDTRERLLEILSLTREYYHFLLTKHKVGQKARDYLKERGVTAESIKIFQMGYALPEWDGLIKYLHKKKKYSLQDIVDSGLVIRNKSNRHYDRFRDRIMFPLKNTRGQVVGFSGRLLDAKAKEAKYINSPETLVYHKSKLLFGYSELFREIKKKNEVIVTEGEFDVVSSAQAHVNNIVAIKGSALTSDQVQVLARGSEKIILALDADEAGMKATLRAINIVKGKGIDLRVIDMKKVDEKYGAKDPDDVARKNPKAWREIASSSISVYEYLLGASLQTHDSANPEGKRNIMVEMAPVINSIELLVEKDFYIRKLAKALNVQEKIIKDDLRSFEEGKIKSPKSTALAKKSVSEDKEQEEQKKQKAVTKKERLEIYVLFLLFRSKPNKVILHSKKLTDIDFDVQGANQVISSLNKYSLTISHNQFSLKKFSTKLSEDLKENLFDWYLYPEHVKNLDNITVETEWESAILSLNKEIIRDKIVYINQEMEKLDSKQERTAEEDQKLEDFLLEIVTLQKN